MPYLRLQTNVDLDADRRAALVENAASLVAEVTDKTGRYVMVAVDDGAAMAFAGDRAPCAFLELRSIGLGSQDHGAQSARICAFLEAELGVPKDRVFVHFIDVPRADMGWNGATFER